MRLRTKIILAIIMFMVGIGAGVAMMPGHFRITRSTLIAAPPSVVFDQVNNFQKWEAWSPWAKTDPSAKISFSGPESGVGTVFRWDGNNEVGAGSMTILESKPGDRIEIALVFTKPFVATNQTEFTFRPEGDQTHVVWTMSGNNNFVGKVISLFMDCEKLIGADFDKGLAAMKSVIEAAPRQ